MALCAGSNCQLFVNYMRIADAATAEVKRRLEDGTIVRPEKAVVWYSKGLFNNGSHLLNLLQYWLGDVTDFKVIRVGRLWEGRDPEPDVAVSFADGGLAYLLAAREENFSHYTIELVAPNGRLYYGRGGEDVRWQRTIPDPTCDGYTILNPAAEIIANDLVRAQWHVADQLAEALNGRPARLSTGKDALRTLETLAEIRAGL